MKKTNALLLAATTLGLGFAAFTTTHTETAQAAYYTWTKTKNYSPAPAVHARYFKETAYVWNTHHTRRLHNLKNYPTTTWYLSKSVKMSNGSKSSIYYRLVNSKKQVFGYVWRGYLKMGGFETYIPTDNVATSSEQSIVKNLFPKATLSARLQQIMQDYTKYDDTWSSMGDSQWIKHLDTQLTKDEQLKMASTSILASDGKGGIKGGASFADGVKAALTTEISLDQGIGNEYNNSNGMENYQMGMYVFPKGSSRYGDVALLFLRP
ncbi:hypothetical protein [Secundilactobacillus kimchicus]|uniref:D-alanyl-D-alanine carboxypeptidase n=1 Tax=Secundilactobacillus kimchicus JCM 15530 TaxID=1302272 RepID=A0A0R1HKW1_9LACO|nr:hypothetical protein [Secundilactobacillus kimchicus]KRK47358.1 hypothetical protein FC96_GL002477 [Secundilactobacillus kimchicus JCM 15530]MBT9672255.1 hypothetical protein [Secundilactobacillus kimchicus]